MTDGRKRGMTKEIVTPIGWDVVNVERTCSVMVQTTGMTFTMKDVDTLVQAEALRLAKLSNPRCVVANCTTEIGRGDRYWVDDDIYARVEVQVDIL